MVLAVEIGVKSVNVTTANCEVSVSKEVIFKARSSPFNVLKLISGTDMLPVFKQFKISLAIFLLLKITSAAAL